MGSILPIFLKWPEDRSVAGRICKPGGLSCYVANSKPQGHAWEGRCQQGLLLPSVVSSRITCVIGGHVFSYGFQLLHSFTWLHASGFLKFFYYLFAHPSKNNYCQLQACSRACQSLGRRWRRADRVRGVLGLMVSDKGRSGKSSEVNCLREEAKRGLSPPTRYPGHC